MSSLSSLWTEFDRCAPAGLDRLPGEHRAQVIGPLWLRLVSPVGLATIGMPFWAGKRFTAVQDGVVSGVNLLRWRGGLRESIPITATVDNGDVTVRYPTDAAWPWPGITDVLRVRDARTLLGMTYGFPGMPAQGLPFLLQEV